LPTALNNFEAMKSLYNSEFHNVKKKNEIILSFFHIHRRKEVESIKSGLGVVSFLEKSCCISFFLK